MLIGAAPGPQFHSVAKDRVVACSISISGNARWHTFGGNGSPKELSETGSRTVISSRKGRPAVRGLGTRSWCAGSRRAKGRLGQGAGQDILGFPLSGHQNSSASLLITQSALNCVQAKRAMRRDPAVLGIGVIRLEDVVELSVALVAQQDVARLVSGQVVGNDDEVHPIVQVVVEVGGDYVLFIAHQEGHDEFHEMSSTGTSASPMRRPTRCISAGEASTAENC